MAADNQGVRISTDSYSYDRETILRMFEAIPSPAAIPATRPAFVGLSPAGRSNPSLASAAPSTPPAVPSSYELVTPAPGPARTLADLEKESVVMNECAIAVTKELDINVLFVKILQAARGLIAAERYSLFLVDSNTNELYSLVADGTEPLRFPMSTGIVGYVLKTQEALIVRDVRSDARFNADIDHKTGFRTRDMMCAPILYDGEKVGVIQCLNAINGAFDDHDLRVLRLFTTFCAIGIGNARVYRQAVQQREKTLLMFEFAKQIAGHEMDINATVQAFMDLTKRLMKADRCTVMLVDAETQELYTTKADGIESFRSPLDVGICGHVATSGTVLNIRDAYRDARFNSDIDKKTGYLTKSILCMPLKADGQIIGVAEMMNKLSVPYFFDAEDEAVFAAFASLCSIIIRNSQLHQSLAETQKQIQCVLHVAMALSDSSDSKALMSTIMGTACKLIDADRFSVFTYDEATDTLNRSQVGLDGVQDGPDITLPASTGFAGYVAHTGEIVNVSDAYQDPRFNQEVDMRTGYRTRSVLSMPIRNEDGKVVAVAQLVNKRAPDGAPTSFRKEDRELMRAFTTFCGKGLTLDKPIEVIQSVDDSVDSFVRANVVTDRERADLLSWNLEPWQCTYNKLLALVIEMFRHFQLFEKFNIMPQKLYRFLVEVSHRYRRTVPYHNFVHAFDVTHAMFMFINECNLRDAYLTDVDILTLLIATLCHDADHRGLTNAFHATTDSPFAMAYRNQSIMESHHVSVAVSLLSADECNVLSGCPPEVYKMVWQALIPTILATDAANKKDEDEFNAMVSSKSFVLGNVFHRRLLMRQLIRLADVSNACRPWEISRYWADKVSTEFYNQGDAERGRGLPVTPLMDRVATPLPKMQVGFLNFVAKPAFNQMAGFIPAMKPLVDQVESNLRRWQGLQ